MIGAFVTAVAGYALGFTLAAVPSARLARRARIQRIRLAVEEAYRTPLPKPSAWLRIDSPDGTAYALPAYPDATPAEPTDPLDVMRNRWVELAAKGARLSEFEIAAREILGYASGEHFDLFDEIADYLRRDRDPRYDD